MNAEQESIEVLRDAWAGCRTSDLQDPARLAEAIDDLRGDARGPLAELLAALMSNEGADTALDRIVLREEKAQKVIERWVSMVIRDEDARGAWRGYAETEA